MPCVHIDCTAVLFRFDCSAKTGTFHGTCSSGTSGQVLDQLKDLKTKKLSFTSYPYHSHRPFRYSNTMDQPGVAPQFGNTPHALQQSGTPPQQPENAPQQPGSVPPHSGVTWPTKSSDLHCLRTMLMYDYRLRMINEKGMKIGFATSYTLCFSKDFKWIFNTTGRIECQRTLQLPHTTATSPCRDFFSSCSLSQSVSWTL